VDEKGPVGAKDHTEEVIEEVQGEVEALADTETGQRKAKNHGRNLRRTSMK